MSDNEKLVAHIFDNKQITVVHFYLKGLIYMSLFRYEVTSSKSVVQVDKYMHKTGRIPYQFVLYCRKIYYFLMLLNVLFKEATEMRTRVET